MIVKWDRDERRTIFQVERETNERGSAMGKWTAETDDSHPIESGAISLDKCVHKVLEGIELRTRMQPGNIQSCRWRSPGYRWHVGHD